MRFQFVAEKIKNLSLFLFLVCCSVNLFAQSNSSLDATKIANKYYNGIVKILLYDSLAEKNSPGTGYLGRGSGFLVTEDGVVFTNRHVIEFCFDYMRYFYYSPSDKKIHSAIDRYSPSSLADQSLFSISNVGKATPIIQVYNSKYGDDYKLYYAKIIAVDTSNFDGAILKIVSDLNGNPVTEKFHPVPIGNSDSTNQGEDLCVYGFPAQYDAGFDIMLKDQSTLTYGKHSGFDYVLNPYYGFIKADASINSGNSGGPVFNFSNKAIGIATATSSKTNMGLVGGINAMYDLASVNPGLLKQLSSLGLAPPAKSPTVKSASSPVKPQLLPSQRMLKRSNTSKKYERKFQGGSGYFKVISPLSEKNQFTITNSAKADPGSIVPHTGEILNVGSPFRGIGIELGHLFPIWRFSYRSKLSLDLAGSASISTLDWRNSALYRDTAGVTIVYNSNVTFKQFGSEIGMAYSYLLMERFKLNVFCKLISSFGSTDGNAVGTAFNTYHDSNQQIGISKFPGFGYKLGFNICSDFYFIGIEYSLLNSSIYYSLPYPNPYTDGNNNSVDFDGHFKASAVSVTLGLTWGGGKKWKKLLDKKGG